MNKKKCQKKCCGGKKFYCYTKTQLTNVLKNKYNKTFDKIVTRSELINQFKKLKYKPPVKDKDKGDYITSDDIYNVMSQYDKNNDSFKFIGIYDIENELKELKTDILKESKNIIDKSEKIKMGIVLWYDYHWVAMFININKRQILYMDSEAILKIKYLYVCDLCENFIKPKLFRSIRSADNDKISFSYNIFDFQNDNYNCGVYVLDFLISMIEDDNTYEKWIDNIRFNIEEKRKSLFK